MKFGLLTLFDHYPEDCSEQQYYKNFFEEVNYAEELGFDSIWIGEHHFCRYICPAPQIIAGAIVEILQVEMIEAMQQRTEVGGDRDVRGDFAQQITL